MKIYNAPNLMGNQIKNPAVYSSEDINSLFDLTDEEAVELTKVISNQVAINKVYSSQKTEERLAEILIEANEFATEQLGKSNFLSIDLATSVDEVVDEHILYLIADEGGANTYNQYVLIGGEVKSLGSTQCDLSNYITNEQLNEKLEDYAKKNEVINASDIVTTIDDTVTNGQIPSALAVRSELQKMFSTSLIIIPDDDLNNATTAGVYSIAPSGAVNPTLNSPRDNWGMCLVYKVGGVIYQLAYFIGGYSCTRTQTNGTWNNNGNWLKILDSKDIVTTLNDLVTDEQVPSALTVKEELDVRQINSYNRLSQIGLSGGNTMQEVFNALPEASVLEIGVSEYGEVTDVPAPNGILMIHKRTNGRFSIEFKRSMLNSVGANELYIGQLNGNDGSGIVWNEVLTSNKMTASLNSSSTDAQILGAKSLYDVIENLRKQLDTVCPKVDWTKRYQNNTTITSFTPSDDELNKYPTSLNSMFDNCTTITSIDMSTINGGLISSYYNFAGSCGLLETVDLSSLISPYTTSIENMFNSCTRLKTLKLPDLSINKITNMQFFLYGCKSLTSVDVSKLDTSNVKSMVSVFDTCTGLTSIDVSGFDTSNVVKFDWMFSNCINLSSLNISNFNTDKATNITGMFYGCREITSLDLSNFNTSNIVSIRKLLAQCTKLTTLKLGSNFIVSKMTDYESLFTGCTALNKIQIPSNFPSASRTFLEARLTEAGILANVTFETY